MQSSIPQNIPLNGSVGPSEPPQRNSDDNRKRIRIACDNCRKKKIKCNGLQPCSNCHPNNAPCLYKERKNKKRSVSDKSRRPGNKSIDVLHSRLSKLENVISRLTDSLDVMAQTNPSKMRMLTAAAEQADDSQDTTTSENEDNNLNYDSEDNEDDPAKTDSAQASADNNPVNTYSPGAIKLEELKQDLTSDKRNISAFPSEQYFGMHSIMCIFSNQSLDWIESTLGPDKETLRPIRNLPILFATKIKSFTSKWMDPPIVDAKGRRRLLEKPFPEDPRIVFDFIDTYYDRISSTKYLCPTEDVRALFEQYYQVGDASKGYLPRSKRRFRQSELLIMTVVLLFAIAAKLDQDKVLSSSSSPTSQGSVSKFNASHKLQNLSDNYLYSLSETLFDNAIYYYHRISVFSDGLDTIQGILLLIIYIESNFVTSHVNYILSSVAIRFAQEMGLHRAESYQNLHWKEQLRRRKVWWYCYFFDVEICFRSGKPPLINASDVTTNSDNDVKAMILMSKNNSGLNPENVEFSQIINCGLKTDSSKSAMQMLEFCAQKSDSNHIILLNLTKIRSRSYNQLFVAAAQAKPFATLCETLESINTEMFALAAYSPDLVRPYFYNDPQFKLIGVSSPTELEDSLSFQLPFFLHLMLINRIPSMVQGSDESNRMERISKFRSVSLDSARTILVLVLQVNKDNCLVSFYNWMVFYPASAFLSLVAIVLNHPNLPETFNDIRLLIETSMNFFSIRQDSISVHDKNMLNSKQFTIGLIMKLMLHVVIKFYEARMKTNVFTEDKKLQDHLRSSRKKFPDIFKDPSEFKLKISKIILGDSVFHGSNINSSFDESCLSNTGDSRSSVPSKSSTSAATPELHRKVDLGDVNYTKGFPERLSFSPSLNPSVANMLDQTEDSKTAQLNGNQPRLHQQEYNPQFHGQHPKHHLHQVPQQHQLQQSSPYNIAPRMQSQSQTSFPYSPSDSLFNQNDLFPDQINDEGFTNVISQMYNLPNFFFDNNLGI